MGSPMQELRQAWDGESYIDEEFENSGVAQHAAPGLVLPATKRSRIIEKKDDEFSGGAHPTGSSSGDQHPAESCHDVILADVLEKAMDGLTKIMVDAHQPLLEPRPVMDRSLKNEM